MLLGSTNPVALDIIASRVAGYEHLIVPTTRTALSRKKWISSENEIEYDGPELKSIVKAGFTKIPVSTNNNIAIQFVMRRIKFLRKTERRPVFNHASCTGCQKCVNICPVKAIAPEPGNKRIIVLTDSKCIRCFCCSEVCSDNAIEVRRKFFGV